MEYFSNTADIAQFNDSDRACAQQLLDTASSYAHMLSGKMTFEEFKQAAEDYGVSHLVEEAEEGYIDEDSFTSYISQIILDDHMGVNATFSFPGSGFKGAEVMVAFGGPNILIDTQDETIRGGWGSLSMCVPYTDNVGFFEAVEEYVKFEQEAALSQERRTW